jgi:hypothetical protein
VEALPRLELALSRARICRADDACRSPRGLAAPKPDSVERDRCESPRERG